MATPTVTSVAVLSLALGIGANLALFTIANSLLLKPLPVREPDRLVLLGDMSWTNPIWEQIRDRQDQLFDGAFAWSNETFDLSTGGVKDPVEGAYASGRLFDVLGVPSARRTNVHRTRRRARRRAGRRGRRHQPRILAAALQRRRRCHRSPPDGGPGPVHDRRRHAARLLRRRGGAGVARHRSARHRSDRQGRRLEPGWPHELVAERDGATEDQSDAPTPQPPHCAPCSRTSGVPHSPRAIPPASSI